MKGIDLHHKEQATSEESEKKKREDKELLVDLLRDDENRNTQEELLEDSPDMNHFYISEGNLNVNDEKKSILDGISLILSLECSLENTIFNLILFYRLPKFNFFVLIFFFFYFFWKPHLSRNDKFIEIYLFILYLIILDEASIPYCKLLSLALVWAYLATISFITGNIFEILNH